MTVPHVFLTRFNLPSEGVESFIRAQDGWLIERFQLFERYSVPSVRAQVGADVHWLVYLAVDSPDWLVERLGRLENDGLLTVLRRDRVGRADLAEDVRVATGRIAGPVITSNLDNDDGLASDFVQRLRATDGPTGRFAIYMANGIILAGSAAYLRYDRHNAFCAVREDLADPGTCWLDWHNRLSHHMPVVVVEGEPAWLQVIHGANVSNRVKGALVDPAPYRSLFGDRLESALRPTTHELIVDRYVDRPVRAVRDSTRSRTRELLVKSLGKERFDSVKYFRRRAQDRAFSLGNKALARFRAGGRS